MASLSQQDVVNKSESTEANPVDTPVNNDTFPVPRGTSDNAASSQAAPGFTDNNPHSSIENGLIAQKDINSSVSNGKDASRSAYGDGRDSEEAQSGQSITEAEGSQTVPELPDNDNFEVGSVRSAGFDGSLGSDTDNMKLETTGSIKDAVPKYSVKKPAGFKPLSVTKSFLAKAGTAVLPIKTTGDKGVASPSSPAPGSAVSTTRPRLVAKTLSNSRSVVPKTSNSGLQRTGGEGPDPNQVWNRNRVQMAPQATPKHMTDEELRQQYGIQLASRPLEGADSNQAKWADLEDEDEDWAPETLEWSDGTKINLAPTETPPPSIPADKANNKGGNNADKAVTAARPSLGPKATVLKLGGTVNQPKSLALTPGTQASSKNPIEKLTLVAKASPILPSKSPWAQLPPVDKVSPVAPPIQQPNAGAPQRDAYNRDASTMNGSQPTREIAADDYSRFSANAAPRELFNSQNGRYEPAPENRRGSMKRDAGFRAPSVLQRPSQNDIHGPSEHSPMFQGRSSQDTAAWRRRRTSSNVSNDNGGRRMSMSRPGLDNLARRDSIQDQPNGTGQGPYLDNSVGSPAISHGFSHASQQSPVVEDASIAPSIDRHVVAQTPQTPNIINLEHEVAQQKKLMRERAEAAMKRRNQVEAKEEAEKRERLRLKLEALEPKAAPVAVAPATLSTLPNGTDNSKESSEHQKSVVPPKPPAPSTNGEPQQYGLIKMHASNQTVTNVGNDGKLLQTVYPPDNNSDNKRGPERLRDQDLGQQSQLRTTTESETSKTVSGTVNHQFEKDNALSPVHRMLGQPGSANFQGSAWNQGSLPNQSSNVNVWAAPGSQKALGNGDFQKNIIHLPPVSSQQYPPHIASQHIQPQPIGTPRQSMHSQTSHPPAIKEHLALPQTYSTEHATQPGQQRSHVPLPTIPKDVQAPVNMQNNTSSRPTGVAAWGEFARNAGAYDAQKRAQYAQEHAAVMAERERLGLPNNQAPIMQETWTQVAISDESGKRQAVATVNAPREPGFIDDSSPAGAGTQHHPVKSRYQDFFNRDGRNIVDIPRPQDPLTPPPEEDDHPVFMGSAQRPKVRLPGSILRGNFDGATPIVRLPPSDVYNKHLAVTASNSAHRLPSASTKHQPFIDNTAWQQRFNGLLHDTAQHKRVLEVAGFSMSKEPLEQLRIPHTSVSLPPTEIEIVEEVAMKSVEEEIALLEEGRDFGSKPLVNIPSQAPIQTWNRPRPYTDVKKINWAKLKDTGRDGVATYLPFELTSNEISSVTVKLPSMQTAKVIPFTPVNAARQQRPSSHNARGAKQRNTSRQHHAESKNKNNQVPTESPAPNATHPSPRSAARRGGLRKASGRGHSNDLVSSAKRTAPAPAAVH